MNRKRPPVSEGDDRIRRRSYTLMLCRVSSRFSKGGLTWGARGRMEVLHGAILLRELAFLHLSRRPPAGLSNRPEIVVACVWKEPEQPLLRLFLFDLCRLGRWSDTSQPARAVA